MKRFLEIMIVVLCVGSASAGRVVYTGNPPLADESALAYDKNFTLDLNANGIDSFAAQVVYSSVTPTAVTFTDGSPSTGSITVASYTGLNPAYATDTLTVATYTALGKVRATNTLTVGTTQFATLHNACVNVYGVNVCNPNDWKIGTTTTTIASSIATAIDTLPNVSATASHGVVTITVDQYGTAGNRYTLSSSTPSALVAGSTVSFSGGQESASFTIRGLTYYADKDWTVGANNNATALNISSFINTNQARIGVTASTSSAVVTLTSKTVGVAGNAYTLVSSLNTALTLGAAAFTGGVDAGYVQIAGTTLTAGTDWTASASVTVTAGVITAAINSNSVLSAVVSASSSTGKVTISAKTAGDHRYYLNGWPKAKFTLSSPALYAATDSSISVANDTITKASHGLTTGLPVLYHVVSGTIPTGLTNNTTYYAIRTDANTFQLAATSTGAVAGTAVNITAQTTLGGGSFTLTPLSFAGTWSWKWRGSNDGTNFVDLPMNTFTYSTPGSSMYDFGTVNFKYLRLAVTAGTAGGMELSVIGNGKGGVIR